MSTNANSLFGRAGAPWMPAAPPTPTVIELDRVSKAFRLGEHVGGRRSLRQWARRDAVTADNMQWALKDVDLTVRKGEILGIVGGNGSGKSTLMKIINQVMAPTSGVSRTRGQITSLLEVGAGFHSELTGRENVFLVGRIMGATKEQTEAALPEIVDFSSIGAYLDTPVKRYSSGMYLRLAFAVSAVLSADTMLVDEVLAVGDSGFQRMCVEKLRSLAVDGRTTLFISHDLHLVDDLCTRTVWLQMGEIRADGPTHEVLETYRRRSS